MGLIDRITGALSGSQGLQRFLSGQADLKDANSPDQAGFVDMIKNASLDDLKAAFSQAAKQTDSSQFESHLSPGSGNAGPLGGLGQGSLGMLASALFSNLSRRGLNLGQLTQMIPGLNTGDPDRMNASEVASLASWTRQNQPDAFGEAAAEVGKKDPGLLQRLLDNKTLMAAAASLASRFLSGK